MIFSVRELSFSLGAVLLEGWLAFAARLCCAALLFGAGVLLRRWLHSRLLPRLQTRPWHLPAATILLRSFAVPLEQLASWTGGYLALVSLPWAITAVPSVLTTLFEIVVTFLLCKGLYAASELTDLLLRSCGEEVRTNKTLSALLNKVYKVLVVVLGVMTIAQETGLPVGSFVASAGLAGLTVSLAAQDTAKNLFSGVVILLDHPFSIGDWIIVEDVEGEVIDINFRSTKVRALDNSVYILTNSTVSAATVKNAALRNKRLYRFTLSVSYKTTRPQLEALMAELNEMLKASPSTYEDTVIVKLSGFGTSSIDILVSAYLRTTNTGEFLQMQNDLNLDLMDVMKRNEVEFAVPSTRVLLTQPEA